MGFLNSLDIAASALTAQRLRMDVIAQNIANVSTTRTESGDPYRRKVVLFQERKNILPFSSYFTGSELGRATSSSFAENKSTDPTVRTYTSLSSQSPAGRGVRVAEIAEDPSDFRLVYEPGHPDADEEGYVKHPNVDVVIEMVNMISASRAYEANITSSTVTKNMAAKALELGKG